MTKMRRERERGGEGGGGGEKEGGVHRVLDHTYPELSVARATLVTFLQHNNNNAQFIAAYSIIHKILIFGDKIS